MDMDRSALLRTSWAWLNEYSDGCAGTQPTLVDYETYEQAVAGSPRADGATEGANAPEQLSTGGYGVLGRVG